MVDWKPVSYPSMSPYLICRDAEKLIVFLEAAFGGELLRRFNRPDGSLMHAEVKVDDSVVMIGGGSEGVATGAVHIHLYVGDALTTFARAVTAGGTVVREPEQGDDGDLRGGVRDPWGTTWWIATQKPRGAGAGA